MNLKKLLGLKREAVLLDSWLFIVKSMAAVAAGYIIGRALPLTRLDMISVLVGVMYNLEPVNLHGIKGGLSQLLASALGAAATGLAVQLFGLNVVTVSISMGLVLYVSLKINWRMVSPVAIFTCVYMTQYMQSDPQGVPSILYTFRLRIAALGLGILVALIFNWLFSVLYYRKLPEKRLELVKENTMEGLDHAREILSGEKSFSRAEFTRLYSGIFTNIEMVAGNMAAMLGEGRRTDDIRMFMDTLWKLKEVNHLTYDTGYAVAGGQEVTPPDRELAVKVLHEASCLLGSIDFVGETTRVLRESCRDELTKFASGEEKAINGRIDENIRRIAKNLLEAVAMNVANNNIL